jgi:hypothetical protein
VRAQPAFCFQSGDIVYKEQHEEVEDGAGVHERVPSFDAVLPTRCKPPEGHMIRRFAYNDQDSGCMCATVDLGQHIRIGPFRG